MRLDTIVVGVPLRESDREVVRWTTRRFAPGARYILVHAVEVSRPPSFLRGVLPDREEMVEGARIDARGAIEELAGSVRSESIETEVRVGRAATAIFESAAEHDADVIVLGPSEERRMGGLLGSTAQHVLTESPVPVLVVRDPAPRRPRRLLTPIDDSERTEPVLRWARDLTRACEGEAVIMHVLAPRFYGSVHAVSSDLKAEDVFAKQRDQTREWIEERLDELGFDPDATRIRIASGDPAHDIVATADALDADVIVIGSRGEEALERALLGSVANRVVRTAPCPVFMVVDTGRGRS